MHEKDSFAGVFCPENSGGIAKQEEFLKECLRNCYCRNSLRNVAGKPFVGSVPRAGNAGPLGEPQEGMVDDEGGSDPEAQEQAQSSKPRKAEEDGPQDFPRRDGGSALL